MRLRTLTPDTVDERIAHVEQLAATGMRQALASVTQAFDDRSTVVLAAALPGSRIWGALQEIFGVWRKTVDEKILPYLQETWQLASADVIAQIQTDWPDYEPPAGGNFVVEYLRRAENHMVGLSTELWENTRNALADGVEAGEGIEQLAARVTAAADVTDFRARAVARTETARAAEAASYDTIVAAGLTGMKEWVATKDDRTRPAHKLADGQRQPIDELYVLYDPPALARYPVDWVLPASQSVNCRCTSVYDIDDEAIVASLAAFRFDPRQPRDGDGKWTDGAPGGGDALDDFGRLPDGSVPAQDEFGGDDPTDPARDKLGLAGRIRLAGGERLLSSGAVNSDEGAFVMAVVDTPQGRRLRIGSVAREDKKKWTGDPGGEVIEDEDTGERIELPSIGSTAELDEAGIGALWDSLERASADLPATLKRYRSDRRAWMKDHPDLDDVPETEFLHPEDGDTYTVIKADQISGARWGDLTVNAYIAEGDYPDDDGPMMGTPQFWLNVQENTGGPTDSDLLTPRGVQNMLKMLDTLVADSGELTAGGGMFAGFRRWRQAYDLSQGGAR